MLGYLKKLAGASPPETDSIGSSSIGSSSIGSSSIGSRPSPSVSATAFRTGTIRTGNDGSEWVVRETAGGVRRWQRQDLPPANPEGPARFAWHMDRPVSSAATARVLDAPLTGFRAGDTVAVLYGRSQGSTALGEPVTTGTLRGVLTALRRGLHRRLRGRGTVVTAQIKNWVRREDRARLTDAHERGLLRAIDLVPDLGRTVMGPLSRTPKGVWQYFT
jgi:hypothetical protein